MICPNCNIKLFFQECIDTEWYENKYYDTVEAMCEKCHKTYQWKDVYIFHHSEDFKEIT